MASESKDSAIDTEGNDDDRYETEEFLVYVDMDTKLLDGQLSESNTKIKFLGIDTEHPIMQLNNQVFKGKYTTAKLQVNCQETDNTHKNDNNIITTEMNVLCNQQLINSFLLHFQVLTNTQWERIVFSTKAIVRVQSKMSVSKSCRQNYTISLRKRTKC